jgi:hypothetical protein
MAAPLISFDDAEENDLTAYLRPPVRACRGPDRSGPVWTSSLGAQRLHRLPLHSTAPPRDQERGGALCVGSTATAPTASVTAAAPAGLYWPGADDEPRRVYGFGGPDPTAPGEG